MEEISFLDLNTHVPLWRLCTVDLYTLNHYVAHTWLVKSNCLVSPKKVWKIAQRLKSVPQIVSIYVWLNIFARCCCRKLPFMGIYPALPALWEISQLSPPCENYPLNCTDFLRCQAMTCEVRSSGLRCREVGESYNPKSIQTLKDHGYSIPDGCAEQVIQSTTLNCTTLTRSPDFSVYLSVSPPTVRLKTSPYLTVNHLHPW